MKNSTTLPRASLLLRVSLFAALCVVRCAGAEELKPPSTEQEQCEASAGGTAGDRTSAQRIYRDPATGKIGPPPRGAVPPVDVPAYNTSSDGLVEEPGKSPAGGVTVHLKGRFRNSIEAIRTHDSTAVRCTNQLEHPHTED